MNPPPLEIPGVANRVPAAGRKLVAGIFLMINSLDSGGSERQFAALARSLDPDSFCLYLGCIQKRGAFLDGLPEMAQFPLDGSLYGLQSLRTRLRLVRHLRRCGVAIAHAFDFYTNLTLIPAARMAGVPVVIGSHRQLGDLLTPAQFLVQSMMLRWCDAVVCNSRAAADRLVEHGLPETKPVVIGNGLLPDAFALVPPALPRLPGSLRVGMIARMNARYKNHSSFLRAAARLHSRFPSLEFLLLGDGPLRPELEREAEALGVRDRVIFLGDRRDVTAILASMDVSVLTSDSESLSNAILESMAAAVPVVATRVGGNPELVTPERGVLVSPEDDDELVSAIGRLLADRRLRAELGQNARQFAQANFGMEGIRKGYEGLYAQLLESKGGRPGARPSRAQGRGSEARLRVAIVAPTLRWVGGQAVQADLLARHWHNDLEVSTWFVPVDPSFPRVLAWVERVPVLRTVLREPLYLATLWRGLRDADIAHIFSAAYWSFLLAPVPAWLIARLRGKKTLINYRSGEARDHLRRFRSARRVLAKADRLVVPSRYLVDVFGEFGLQAEAIPNIVDLSQFSYRSRKRLRPHLLCPRGFHPYYCADLVVRAFAKVQGEFPDARLVLAGTGTLEAEIRSLVQELKLSAVNFSGVASRQDIGRIYDQADIFINASRVDNMPVSVLEAFSSGTVVVSTAPEGMSYLVEHDRTGLLSQPVDARALAQNVIRLLRDPELASRLAFNAFEESQRYRWETVREQWLKVYKSLACRNVDAGFRDSPLHGPKAHP